jgi:hypothetical protein
MKRHPIGSRLYPALAGLPLVLCMSGQAQGSESDPTRPPTWQASTHAAGTSTAVYAPAPGTRLTLLLAGERRRLALIDGELRTEGQALGPQHLVRIDRHGVTLSGDEGQTRLPMHPGVRKSAPPVRHATAPATKKARP